MLRSSVAVSYLWVWTEVSVGRKSGLTRLVGPGFEDARALDLEVDALGVLSVPE